MKKILLTGLAVGVMTLCLTGVSNAGTMTLVDQNSTWQYSVLNNDLWPTWGGVNYDSFDWQNAAWSNGQAAFGNSQNYGGSGLYYNTYWAANTDLALQKSFNIGGVLSTPITLNVASDNGFAVFINGHQVAMANAEGFTSYWEYVLPLSASTFLSPGENLIQVLAEDHGGITFFDLKLTGDVAPVPEPATLLLLGTGITGMVASRRKKKA